MSTDAIKTLMRIIANPDHKHVVKLDACETLLKYETPQEIIDFARRYLASIFDWKGPIWDAPDVGDQLKAAKLMRELEAARIRPRTVEPRPLHTKDIDPAYLEERLATMRERQRQAERGGKVESMDEIRARLRLNPAKSS